MTEQDNSDARFLSWMLLDDYLNQSFVFFRSDDLLFDEKQTLSLCEMQIICDAINENETSEQRAIKKQVVYDKSASLPVKQRMRFPSASFGKIVLRPSFAEDSSVFINDNLNYEVFLESLLENSEAPSGSLSNHRNSDGSLRSEAEFTALWQQKIVNLWGAAMEHAKTICEQRQSEPGTDQAVEVSSADEAERDASKADSSERMGGKEPKTRLTAGVVAQKLERLRVQGEPFISQSKFAKDFGCSKATVNKAIKNTPSLHDWAKPQGNAGPRAQSLTEVVTDAVSQSREPNPADIVEDEDAEVALRYLIEQAGPEEKARILSMTPEKQHDLAVLAFNDPDRNDKILGRKA